MESPAATLTLVKATVNSDSEQAEPAIRSCTGGSTCDQTSTVALVDKATGVLDSAFMSFDTTTLVLTVTPTIASQRNTYTMELT